MNEAQMQQAAQAQPFSYLQRVQEGGGQSKWQVDTTDLKDELKKKLLGIELATIQVKKYYLTNHEGKVQFQFWQSDLRGAQEKFHEYCEFNDQPIPNYVLYETEEKDTVEKWVKISTPLVNDDGCYHLLSFTDPIFSRMGYLSQLSSDEVKDMMWDDVVVPLHLSIIQNHVTYGITKGSRDEIVALFTSMCQLILKASEEGWTGRGLRESVRELISTKDQHTGKLKLF